ncbi:MAG: fumarylacetoacetate hydrolase family protein [Candidatus Marinimicrobia bacterium]|nr:fumarylacetoacetate hydrolase family protein [Candidatus Neomarinimicrobiota bacterium]
MKFVTYTRIVGTEPRFGFIRDNYVVDILYAAIFINDSQGNQEFLSIPTSLKRALENWDDSFESLKKLERSLPDSLIHTYSAHEKSIAVSLDSVQFLPPVPDPRTFRDYYAFEQHVKTARKNRGLEIDPLWYKVPVFYFSNPTALFGHLENIPYPEPCQELDYELEIAAIIAKGGKNISSDNAHTYIGGYTICNDWSARDFQREEMRLNLGPAKGKDFATSFGPYMVTPDELLNNDGQLNLKMTCHINGELYSDGQTSDMYHSFSNMIERASQNTKLFAGDYIGSGTVGTGCILELGPENTNGWLKKGDSVKMKIEGLGTLENTIQ